MTDFPDREHRVAGLPPCSPGGPFPPEGSRRVPGGDGSRVEGEGVPLFLVYKKNNCSRAHECNPSGNGVKPPDFAAMEEGLNLCKGGHKKAAEVLFREVKAMAERFGLQRLLFVTLTTADEVSYAELTRRCRNLWQGVGSRRWWERAISTPERGTYGGRLHLHLLVVAHSMWGDVRGSADFEEFRKGVYSSAEPSLRRLWAEMRERLPGYGFGRAESLPIKSTAEGISRYVGGYIKKGIEKRLPEDKGRRLVRYMGFRAGAAGDRYSERVASTRFMWAKGGGWLWRNKLAKFVEARGLTEDILESACGSGWRYALRGRIHQQCAEPYPDLKTAIKDGWSEAQVEVRPDGVWVWEGAMKGGV